MKQILIWIGPSLTYQNFLQSCKIIYQSLTPTSVLYHYKLKIFELCWFDKTRTANKTSFVFTVFLFFKT